MLFPWQAEAWQHIVKQVRNETLPHAYLFSGLEGVGKLDFAKTFAQYLLCEVRINPIQESNKNNSKSLGVVDARACGQCKQCKLFQSGTHPDLKIIEPDEGSKILKINMIRGMVDFFNQSSMQGGRKIAIIAPAEALNNNAANALLKTLEEPSDNSNIFLISHSSGRLLPTIRSRCQVLDFNLPSKALSISWLFDQAVSSDEPAYREDELRALLDLASQAPLRARYYLKIDALKESQIMLAEIGQLLKKELLASTVSERWNDDISTLRLSWLIQWVCQIVKFKQAAHENQDLDHVAGGKMLNYLAEKGSFNQLFALYKASLCEYKLFLGTSNPNKILSFESLLHRWQALMVKT